MNIFSKNPKLSLEKMLVFGALGLYVYRHLQLQRKGELKGEPDLMLRIDKQKVVETASKHLKLSGAQKAVLGGLVDTVLGGEDEGNS